MGRKPGIPNKPNPGISKADAIMAVVYDLSDRDIQAAMFMRSIEKLNAEGKIEACKYMIRLFQEPLKYVRSGATMADCEHAIYGLNKIICDLQREQEKAQEVKTTDEDHQ